METSGFDCFCLLTAACNSEFLCVPYQLSCSTFCCPPVQTLAYFFPCSSLTLEQATYCCVKLPSLSKLSLKAVANTVLGRNFPFELVLWYLHMFIWKNSCSASFRIRLRTLMLRCWHFLLSWLKHLSSYASTLNQTKLIVWGAIPWKNCLVNVGWCDPCVLPDKWQNQWKEVPLPPKVPSLPWCMLETWNFASERQCLLSFVSWVCLARTEWESLHFRTGGKQVCLKHQTVSSCHGTGVFYWWMSRLYRPMHTLIFCSHSVL